MTIPPNSAGDTTGADAATASSQDEASAQVLRHFRRVFNAVKTHFQQVEKKSGIGGAQLWALSAIHATPALGVNDLAAVMDIHQTTASNLVKALLKLALIKTEKSSADRRAVQLSILPAGLQVLAQAPGPFAGVLPTALAQLDPLALRRLDADLLQLLQLLHADEAAGQTPLAEL